MGINTDSMLWSMLKSSLLTDNGMEKVNTFFSCFFKHGVSEVLFGDLGRSKNRNTQKIMDAASPITRPITAIFAEIVFPSDMAIKLIIYTQRTRIDCSANCDIDGIVAFCKP